MTTTSVYPGALDTFATHGATMDQPEEHENIHLTVEDAIEKIETELGTNPSGSSATVKARLDTIDSETGLVRRRSTRPSQAFPSGTTQTMTAAVTHPENVGGIGYSGGTYTVPVAGTYAVAFVVDPDVVLAPSTSSLRIVTSNPSRDIRVPAAASSGDVAATPSLYLAASATLTFWVVNVGVSFNGIPTVEVTKVTST